MFKKKMSIFLLFSMICLLIPQMSVFAATNSNITLGFTTAASGGTLSPNFTVTNNGSSAVNLSDLTLKYFFTKDDVTSLTYDCDYTNAAVRPTATFSDYKDSTGSSVPKADTYMQFSFASGQLAANSSITINGRLHSSTYGGTFDATNDYSKDATTVAAYIAGTIVAGSEPIVINNSTLDISSATFDNSNPKDVVAKMTLNGNTLKGISNGTALTANTDYTVSADNVVTISKAYLAKLAAGTSTLTFNFSAGNDATIALTTIALPDPNAFKISIDKVQAAPGSTVVVPVRLTNVPSAYVDGATFNVKYDTNVLTFVSASAGAIVPSTASVYAQNDAGVVGVLYSDETTDSTGYISKNGVIANLTFTVAATATVGTVADVTIDQSIADTFLVVSPTLDDNGDNIVLSPITADGSVTVSNKTVVTNTVSPTTATFDKTYPADIAVTVDNAKLTGIYNGTTKLAYGTCDVKTSTGRSILKAYLSTLAVGTYTFRFTFTSGSDATMTIKVIKSQTTTNTVSPATATFDKTYPADIAVTVNNSKLTGIYNGTTKLAYGTGDVSTSTGRKILKSYLSTLAVGTYTFRFTFTSGSDATMTIKVIKSQVTTNPITPTTATFDKTTPADIAVTLDNTKLTGIYNGTTKLAYGNGDVSTSTGRTLLKGYLATLPLGTNTITFKFTTGSATLTINVVSSGSVTFNKSNPTDIAVTLDNSKKIAGIYNGTTKLVYGSDDVITSTGRLLLKGFLSKLSVGSNSVKFNYTDGTSYIFSFLVK